MGNSDQSQVIGTKDGSPSTKNAVLELSHFQIRADGFGHSPGCTLTLGSKHKHFRQLLTGHLGSKKRGARCKTVCTKNFWQIKRLGFVDEVKQSPLQTMIPKWNTVYLLIFDHDRTAPPEYFRILRQNETNPLTTPWRPNCLGAPLEDLWRSFCPTLTCKPTGLLRKMVENNNSIQRRITTIEQYIMHQCT